MSDLENKALATYREKTAKTRLMKEFLANPDKISKVLFGPGKTYHAENLVKSLVPNMYGASSGHGIMFKKLFSNPKEYVALKDLSYQNPLKRLATYRNPDQTFTQLALDVPKKFF